jgi:hypothetical protein
VRAGRPVAIVTVTSEHRLEHETWGRRPKTTRALAMRSRIIFLAAQGESKAPVPQIRTGV